MIKHPLSGHGQLTVYGVCLHTTGDGIPAAIVKNSTDPVKETIDTYAKMAANNGVGPHYAITPDGQLIKFRDHAEVAWHAGTSASERQAFLSGTWEDGVRCPKAVSDWWKLRWGAQYKSPQHLFPSRSPNADYIGIELVPCGTYSGNIWQPLLGVPSTPKGRYTGQQYQTAALLTMSLARAYNLTDDFWNTGRLVGHEDINPLTRPGWDVGAFNGWWSWSLFRDMLKSLDLNTKGQLIDI